MAECLQTELTRLSQPQ